MSTCKRLDFQTLRSKPIMPKNLPNHWTEHYVVPDEPVKFAKLQVEVQDFRKVTDHFRGILGMYLTLIKRNRKIITCALLLDLETLGF